MSENDPRLYNVNRDVAHNFEQVAKLVFNRLQNRLWPELEEVISSAELTDEEMGQAVEAFALFLASAKDEMRTDMAEALEKAGWFRCKPAAQVAIMATLGTVTLGFHFAGIREATLAGSGPALTLTGLAQQGKQCAAFLAKPRWRRRLSCWRRRIRSALRSLLGHD